VNGGRRKWWQSRIWARQAISRTAHGWCSRRTSVTTVTAATKSSPRAVRLRQLAQDPAPLRTGGDRRQGCVLAGDRREEVHQEGAAALELQHLYRATHFLDANKDAFEKAIYFRMAGLF
jgi:hypothetical protein